MYCCCVDLLRWGFRVRVNGRGAGMLERAVAKGETRAAAILGVLKMTGLAGYSRDLAAGREMLERAVAAGEALPPTSWVRLYQRLGGFYRPGKRRALPAPCIRSG